MPRRIRLNDPGVTYHLISRFVDRNWFITSDEERERYLFLLGRALRETDWKCFAYAIMSSHIHLALIAGSATLKSWIGRVHPPFATWMNERHDRIGPIFVRGPRDYAMRVGQEPQLLAYLHNNPVRANIVPHPRESTWTSHRAYTGLAPVPTWLDVSTGLALAGFAEAQQFDDWVAGTPGDSGRVSITEARRLARQRGAVEVATPTRGVAIPLVGRPWSRVRPDPRSVVGETAEACRVPVLELCSRRRTATVLRGRFVAIHAGLRLGLTATDIACALGISQQAASVISRSPPVDEAVERQCRRVVAACSKLCK